MSLDIRVVALGSVGYPLKDLTAGTSYENVFRIGKFDFPCIPVGDLNKFEKGIVLKLMVKPNHRFHGYLIVAPVKNRIVQYGSILASDATETITPDTTYKKKVEEDVYAKDITTLTLVYLKIKMGAAGSGNYKVCGVINSGAEVDIVPEQTFTNTDYETKTHAVAVDLGLFAVLRVYVKCVANGANNAHLKDTYFMGDIVAEISGEKYSVTEEKFL